MLGDGRNNYPLNEIVYFSFLGTMPSVRFSLKRASTLQLSPPAARSCCCCFLTPTVEHNSLSQKSFSLPLLRLPPSSSYQQSQLARPCAFSGGSVLKLLVKETQRGSVNIPLIIWHPAGDSLRFPVTPSCVDWVVMVMSLAILHSYAFTYQSWCKITKTASFLLLCLPSLFTQECLCL